MKANEKAFFFCELFKDHVSLDKSRKEYRVEIEFAKRGNWLTEEEEMFLRLFEAQNIFATEGWGKNMKYTDELNSAVCGDGVFIFEDDEDKIITDTSVIILDNLILN
jgi:hypothetical protein